MPSLDHAPAESAAPAAAATRAGGSVPAPPEPRPMTRCECAELDFAEIPKRLAGEALSLEAVGRRTGCGMLCSACGPDLDRFLARARQGVTR